ncbi:MAG: Ig-like domain-containing protein [Terriglobales bacterium]
MRRRLLLFVLSLSVLFISSSFSAMGQTQRPKVMAPHRAIPPRADKQVKWLTPMMQRSMIGGLWMTDANWKSAIYLRNGVETDPVTVTPILHLSNGVKYTLPDVTLPPAGNAIIDINQGVRQFGIASFATLSGYAEIQYNWPWDPFCATIRNVDTAHSLIFTYGLQTTAPPPLKIVNPVTKTPTNVMEGMWWKQERNVTGFIALANISSRPIQVSVTVIDNQANSLGQHQVTVSPQGMKLVDLAELASATVTQGGIQIASDATTDNLIVNGGLEDSTVGYSANLPFAAGPVTPSTAAATTIAELGLMAGAADPMMLFPAGTTFTPYSVLRNVSSAPISVTPTLWWMAGGLPHSAQLAPLSLQPHQTQSLDGAALLTQAGLASATKTFNGTFNLVLDANTKPGDLLLAAGSVDQTNTYVFEVVPRTVSESGSKSFQYWSTGNGDDTMVTLWNPTDEAQDFALTLFFALPDGSRGHYVLPLHLEARVSRTFNVSEIIQTQVPDAEGNVIPAVVREGGMKIAGSIAENQHIMIVADAGIYNVRKATCGVSCGQCDGYSSAAVVAGSFGLTVNATQQLNFMGTWNSGTQYNLGGAWSSNNNSVATVGGGLVTAKSPGTADISALVNNEPVEAGYICYENSCPTSSFGGGSSGTVTPKISQNTPLWYFGNGIPTPSGFTLGSTSATLTASGGGSGTYGWSITSGSSKAVLQGTTSGQNITSVTIASTSYSTAQNDVTVQLQFEPTNGNSSVQTSYSLSIDSPYKLVVGTIADNGASINSSCDNPDGGSDGYSTKLPYTVMSFFGTAMGFAPMNESFSNISDDYIGNNWPTYSVKPGTANYNGQFVDEICVIASPGALTPSPLPPQNGSVKIDHGQQAWFAGIETEAEGVEVQSDTLQRYQDHGRHLSITSPVR